MTTERADPAGAQPGDPAWARLLFVLVEGRNGQWWRGSLLVALAGLVMAALVGALVGALALAGWVGGVLGVGSLTAAAALTRRRKHTLR